MIKIILYNHKISDHEALKEFNEKFSLNIENTDVKELDFDEKNIRS